MNEQMSKIRAQVVSSIVAKEDELKQLTGLAKCLSLYVQLPPELVAFGDSQIEKLEHGIGMRKNHLDCIDSLDALSKLAAATDEEEFTGAETLMDDDAFMDAVGFDPSEGEFIIDLGNVEISFEPSDPEEIPVENPFREIVKEAMEKEDLKPEELMFKWDDSYPVPEDENVILVAAGNVSSFMGGTMIEFAGIDDGIDDGKVSTKTVQEVLTDRLGEIMPGNTIEIQIVIK